MSKKDFPWAEKRKQTEEVSVDEVYKEFVETFEDVKKPTNMSWVRGDVVNADKSESLKASFAKDRLYKPKSKLEELASSFKSVQDIRAKKEDIKPVLIKKDNDKKRTSNLENLKEELKRQQEERAERRRLREQLERLKDEPDRKTRFDPVESERISLISAAALRSNDDILNSSGSFDVDPNTTNIYIQNIDGKVSESSLCEVFGKFGPLASVKIMWPRTEEERSRGRNAAFVAYMNRTDAERAMAILPNRILNGIPLRLGWGKCIAIPPYPIYMPPKLAEIMQPQSPTGLPFNCALPTEAETKHAASLTDTLALEKTLEKAVVRVVAPTERALLHIVHRMVEFVCREGPMFEAMIMNREINNPMFRFLFDNKSPTHIYYRWKLFSILQGDSPKKWRTEDFRMFVGGSVWRPPPINPFTQSLPLNLFPREDELPPLADGSERSVSPTTSRNGDRSRERHSSDERSPRRRDRHESGLSDRQRAQLEDMLKELTAERRKVGDLMVWCLDHASSADEIVDRIVESLSILNVPLPKKIARLYLVSDLLHNAQSKVTHAFSYRKLLQSKLVQIFSDLHVAYDTCDARMKKEQFKTRVMSCFRAWEGWAIMPNEFLIHLQNVFFGLVKVKEDSQSNDEDIEGQPVDLGDVDGEPLLNDQTAGLLTSLYGTPVGKLKNEPAEKKAKLESPSVASRQAAAAASKPGFQKSKWEEVDPEQIEAQAITTSRWDFFEEPATQEAPNKIVDDDIDGEEISNEDDDIDGAPIEDSGALLARMKAIAAARTQAQRVVPPPPPPHQQTTPNSRSGGTDNMSEERRNILREIELQVMEYQDELEGGQRPRESGLSIAQQVQRYREQLLAQANNSSIARNQPGKQPSKSGGLPMEPRKPSSNSGGARRRSRSSSRSPSRKASKTSRRSRSRSRSRSPNRKSSRRY